EPRRVHAIDRERLRQQPSDRSVDLLARGARIEPRLRAHRQLAHFLGEVALVRAAHEGVGEAEGRDDLGGGGKERDDPRRVHARLSVAGAVGVTWAKTNPPRSTTGPTTTVRGLRNIGPPVTHVWNSPFSPDGSTPAGRSATRRASNGRPAK